MPAAIIKIFLFGTNPCMPHEFLVETIRTFLIMTFFNSDIQTAWDMHRDKRASVHAHTCPRLTHVLNKITRGLKSNYPPSITLPRSYHPFSPLHILSPSEGQTWREILYEALPSKRNREHAY